MEAKAQSPANMAKALLPTIILLFATDNGPVAPAAKVAEPKMAAAPRAHPKAHQRRLTRASRSGEGTCWRWHRRSRRCWIVVWCIFKRMPPPRRRDGPVHNALKLLTDSSHRRSYNVKGRVDTRRAWLMLWRPRMSWVDSCATPLIGVRVDI